MSSIGKHESFLTIGLKAIATNGQNPATLKGLESLINRALSGGRLSEHEMQSVGWRDHSYLELRGMPRHGPVFGQLELMDMVPG